MADILDSLSDESPWITEGTLGDILNRSGADNLEDIVSIPEPVPVWRELSFSNSCELRDILDDLDQPPPEWHVVDDPKLFSIIQADADNDDDEGAFNPHIIVTATLPTDAWIRTAG